MSTARRLGIGLYGSNGHQLGRSLMSHPRAELVAVSAMSAERIERDYPGVRAYNSLGDLLADDRIELVSLCSPIRATQAEDAIAALRAGKSVLAEKPAALSEAGLDRVLAEAERTGGEFREMGGTVSEPHYSAMRDLIAGGSLGQVKQIFVQKSYVFGTDRSWNDDVDGGLVRQVGIHAFRLIEHLTGVRIDRVRSIAAPRIDGVVATAAAMLTELEDGSVGNIVVNYLNPVGTGIWGNDEVRVFGTDGMVESLDGGRRTRLVLGATDLGSLRVTRTRRSYFDEYVDHLLDGSPMPRDPDDELHPLRIAIRAYDDLVNEVAA